MGFPSKKNQFKPGQSGNPGGSSKRRRLTSKLLELLDAKQADSALMTVGLKAALEGDFKFWSYIFERIDGPATLPDMSVDDNQPQPRIVIPRSAPRRAGGPKAARRPRKR